MKRYRQAQKSSLASYVERPKDVRFADREPGEQNLLLLRQHPVTNLPWMTIFAVLLGTPYFLSQILTGSLLDPGLFSEEVKALVTIFWYLFTFGYGFLQFISWFFNIYLITDRRVVDLDYLGFMFYRLSEAELVQIQDVTYQVGGLFRTLFNFGDVYIQTAAEQREFAFGAVPRPATVHDLITDLAESHD